MTYTCERVCQYAMDVGVPEYSGITNGTCGNCDHYAPDPVKDCVTPECPRPAVVERRTGENEWESIYQDMCRGCASDHDDEVRTKGWLR